jgi:protein-tyrosine phosphatase
MAPLPPRGVGWWGAGFLGWGGGDRIRGDPGTITPVSSPPELGGSRPRGWRAHVHRYGTRLYGPSRATVWLTWIPQERIAIGTVPTALTLGRLREEGITHVVNCRAAAETWLFQDLAVERALFGAARVAHAPMWDTGRRQHPRRWAHAALFAAGALTGDATARVLIHCQAGSHRSVLVAYAVLRLRGHSGDDAARLILDNRAEAELLPAYRASVDQWVTGRAALA